MKSTSTLRTLRRRVILASARWASYLLFAAWITLGLLWSGLHFVIVPRIGELRPWLEQQVSQRLHTTVRIGAISARSNGLIPSVELRDVRFLDASGRESLHLPVVLAAFSPRSVVGARFEQLYIDAPVLDVRRSGDGRIWVAGLLVADAAPDSSGGLDWLFSQTELVVRHGSLRWTDELRGAAPLDLDDVDVVLRNRGRNHAGRFDANPPSGWGTRLTVMGKFLQPLFSVHRGEWKNWKGSMYAQADHVDLEYLHNYVDLGFDLRQGAGGARAWVDVDREKIVGATVDLSMQQMVVQLSPQLQPLSLDDVSGRLNVRAQGGGYEFWTQTLAFDTAQGLHWPGGNVHLTLAADPVSEHSSGTLVAQRLDLATLASVASRLPLDEAVHQQLLRLDPQGQLERLSFSWEGPLLQPRSYAASGRVAGLALAAQAQTPAPTSPQTAAQDDVPGVPGVQGASLDFDFTQAGGHARVAISNGHLDFPGIFEHPQVPIDQLASEVGWKVDGRRISVELNHLRFTNADAQGEAHVKWQTADLPRGAPASLRFPGVLDLQGSLSRAEVKAVPRYLPLAIDRDVRSYLQQSLVGGAGSNVHFRVHGDLGRFPFADARQGDFHISADLHNASFAYAPASVMPKASLPWPALTQIDGDFLIDHDTLRVRASRGLLAPGSSLWFARTEAVINKLYSAPLLNVSAESRGPLGQALGLVNSTPLGPLTGKALAHAQGSGLADYKFKLALPLDTLDKATVQGTIGLNGNEFQFAPDVPRVSRLNGVVGFSDSGIVVSGLQGHALGGDVRIDGGLNVATATAGGPTAAGPAHAPPGTLRIQGSLSAQGLLQATSELGPVARLGHQLEGSTPYTVAVTLRGGLPEVVVSSSLAGMAVNLPAPFGKTADSVLPLRLESLQLRPTPPSAHAQDQWRLDVGQLASVVYVRDVAGPQPLVLRGSIAVGLSADEAAPLPASGVVANVHVDQLDVDAWSTALAGLIDGGAGQPGPAPTAQMMGYLPNHLALRVGELTVQRRKINSVLIGAAREGLQWRMNVAASELNGYVEYRQPSDATPGRLYARLEHLTLAQSAEQDMENLLDQQPASIPALDVVVNEMELGGKRLGRVEIQAVNLGSGGPHDSTREWKLNRFNITTPEASLSATGNWAAVAASGAGERSARERRRTALNFKLEIGDSGELLGRLGMPGVLAKGRGSVEGQVAWMGSPFSPDYASMSGGFHVDVETGQFLKAEPGIAKLLGVLSLQSLPRRLALDFRDVFSDGFAFDFVRGDAQIAQGIARTNNLQMKGVNAAVLMEGQADIDNETQQLKVVVIPEINAGSASLLATTINPLVGLTTFLAQVILRKPLIEANTQEFLIDGTWVDPHVTKVVHK